MESCGNRQTRLSSRTTSSSRSCVRPVSRPVWSISFQQTVPSLVTPSPPRPIWLVSTLPAPYRKCSFEACAFLFFCLVSKQHQVQFHSTFNRLWRQVGENINIYNNFPRLIGECGGKNYHFVHPSADVQSVVNGTIRSSFEFCGQKCSACSRMYVPESLWPQVKEGLIKTRDTLKIGDVTDFSTFTSAVIDDKAFNRIKSYIDHAKSSKNLEIIAGGKCDDSKGYFIEPTIVQSNDPKDKIMTEEIFGPVLSIYVYKDKDLDQTMKLVGNSTRFALTGAVFSKDE